MTRWAGRLRLGYAEESAVSSRGATAATAVARLVLPVAESSHCRVRRIICGPDGVITLRAVGTEKLKTTTEVKQWFR